MKVFIILYLWSYFLLLILKKYLISITFLHKYAFVLSNFLINASIPKKILQNKNLLKRILLHFFLLKWIRITIFNMHTFSINYNCKRLRKNNGLNLWILLSFDKTLDSLKALSLDYWPYTLCKHQTMFDKIIFLGQMWIILTKIFRILEFK